MRTGAPTTSAMKIVRRDHSISPIERSKMRRLETTKPGARRPEAAVRTATGAGGDVSFVISQSAFGNLRDS